MSMQDDVDSRFCLAPFLSHIPMICGSLIFNVVSAQVSYHISSLFSVALLKIGLPMRKLQN